MMSSSTIHLCMNHKILFTRSLFINYPTFPKAIFRNCRPAKLKCYSNSSGEGQTSKEILKDMFSGMVDNKVEGLLNKDENKELLDGLEKASMRVELARKELAEIEKQELEAKQLNDYINKLESRAFEVL